MTINEDLAVCKNCLNWTELDSTESYWGYCSEHCVETKYFRTCDDFVRKDKTYKDKAGELIAQNEKLLDDYTRMKDTLLYIAEHSREELTVLMAINAAMVGK